MKNPKSEIRRPIRQSVRASERQGVGMCGAQRFTLHALLLFASLPAFSQLDISWNKVAGGGGSGANTQFTIAGTIGQADAGHLSVGNFALDGGFWAVFSTNQTALFTGVTRVWAGAGADNNWATAANWSNSVAPSAGDNLLFPTSAGRRTNVNNFGAGTIFNNLSFAGTNSVTTAYSISGNSIKLNSGVVASNSLGAVTISNALTLLQAQSIVNNSGGQVTIAGTLDNGGSDFTADGNGTNLLAGQLIGAGRLIKAGTGMASLAASNTYSGATMINQGTLELDNAFALGNTSGAFVNNDASLSLASPGTINKALTLNSSSAQALNNASGSNTWSGFVALNADTSIRVANLSDSLVLGAATSGPGQLIKTGPGTLMFAGFSGNSHGGGTVVNQGTLTLNKSGGTIAIPGALVIGDGLGGANADVVRLLAANQIVDSASVTVNGSGLFDLNGFSDTIASLNMTGGNVTTGVGTLGLNGDVSAISATNGVATITGFLSLNSAMPNLAVSNGPFSPDMLIAAHIVDGSVSAGLNKTGGGELSLSGSNSYSGLTIVAGGFLEADNSFALGLTNAGTVVSNGAVLLVRNGSRVGNEPLTLNGGTSTFGALGGSSGSNSWAGDVVVNATSTIGSFFAADTFNVSGAISGPGGLTKVGSGNMIFSGTSANTYAGGTTVNSGSLLLNKSPGVNSVPGPLTIGDGVGGASADQVRVLSFNQIADNAAVTITDSGLLTLNTSLSSETIGSLAGSAGANVALGNNTLITGGNNASTAFAGTVSGTNTSNITKQGTGSMFLTGNSALSFVGTATIFNGALLVDGSLSSSAFTVFGGSLGGHGLTGPVTCSGGAVSPGDSPGILSTSGNVLFTNGSTFAVDLNGTTPGSGYDILNVTGTVSIASDTLLQVSLGYIPSPGDSFMIIANDGADAISGTFAGLANGASFVTNNTRFIANYSGGTGNDLVLTVGQLLTGNTRVWTGAGTNGFWSNPANWALNIPPVAGDSLSFPIGAARLVNTNDLAAGTSFNQITLSGSNYVIRGNSIYLNTGLSNNAAFNSLNYFNCPIVAGAPLIISAGANFLNLDAKIDLGPFNAIFYSAGTISSSGEITGSGGITLGSGGLALHGSNSYSGLTVVAAGLLTAVHSAALGAVSSGTVVSNGATLSLFLGVSVGNEPLTLNGGGAFAGFGAMDAASLDTNSWAGPITLATDSTISVGDSGLLTLSGLISGPGALTKIGPGTLRLAGANPNTFSGGTLVNEGALSLANQAGSNGLLGPITIGDGSGGPDADVLRLEAIGQLAPTVAVTMNSSGLFDLAGLSHTIGSLAGSGRVRLGGATLDTGGNNTSTVYGGAITGPLGALTKNGAGTMTLNGNNTYSGLTTIAAGTLLVNGSQPASPVTISSSATLGGSGTVGEITMYGAPTISPGNSPGILSSSNVAFTAASTYRVELNGAIPGAAGYDQLNVHGNVGLNGCLLSPSLGFTPAVGSSFIIIHNAGTNSIAGTFGGLPEGALLTIGGYRFQVSYAAGPGSNNVILTHLAAPPSTITAFSLQTNSQALLQGSGVSNLIYLLQANADLSTTNWLIIGQAVADGTGAFYFADTNAPLFPTRFYRVLSP